MFVYKLSGCGLELEELNLPKILRKRGWGGGGKIAEGKGDPKKGGYC